MMGLVQLRLEAAWAASEEDAELQEAYTGRVNATIEALKVLPPLKASNGSQPMVTGEALFSCDGVQRKVRSADNGCDMECMQRLIARIEAWSVHRPLTAYDASKYSCDR